MPMAFQKNLIDISEGDIASLITNQVRENQNLEYKETIYGNADEETREMLRDISSLANAQGGHILIGVKEDNQNEGLPIQIVGIANGETACARIVSSCLSNVDERIPGLATHLVPLSGGNHVLIVQIPKSPRAPHIITFKGLYQFWKRHDRQKSRMSVTEIKEACNATEQLMTRTEEFLKQRKKMANKGQSCYFISATPFFAKDEIIDIYDQQIREMIKHPPDQRRHGFNLEVSGDVKPTLQGLISEIPEYRCLEIFRNGHCEFTAHVKEFISILELDGNRYPILNSYALVEYVVSFIRFYKKVFEYLNLMEPVIISVNLFNINQFGLYERPEQHYQSKAIDIYRGAKIWREEDLEIPPQEVLYFDLPDKIARLFTDRIWNAFGYERSPHFDGKDNFDPK